MLYVPFYIEVLRARPRLMFWVAVLAQAAMWIAVPMLFYTAPPGELPQVLAIGHEFQFGSDAGPPLAFWLAEIAYRLAGLFGVYVLSQICVITTYWCVFALGRAIVGPAQAVLAVLLMVGISLFTVPSPDFGPAILTMALWALALLHYWRAVVEGRSRSWYALGCAAALIFLSSEAALILLGMLVLFTLTTERGRAATSAMQPWIMAAVLVVFLFLHLLWLEGVGDSLTPTLERLREAGMADQNTSAWLRLLVALVLAHAGLIILVALASGWPRIRRDIPAPVVARATLDPMAVPFVKVFALLPALLATIVAVLIGRPVPIGGAAPLVVLSGLAVVIAAGDHIQLFHQRILGFAWAGLLIVPAVFVPFAITLLPWTLGTDLSVVQPAAAMGRFFAESFERRTGHQRLF
jgi:Dolichyl-phosphate-mannose-protein mannosyltransferase